MHTLMVMAGGWVALGVLLAAGRLLGWSRAAMAKAALLFVPLWFVGAGINMWIGVAQAGYSVREELPIFLLIFAAPAAVALVVWWKFKAAGRHD